MGEAETEDSEGGRRRSSGMHIFFWVWRFEKVVWGLEPDDVVRCWAICAGSGGTCGGDTEKKD